MSQERGQRRAPRRPRRARARQGAGRAQAPGAARGGPPVRAVARRRVVRDGADGGLRRRHARRGVGHRRLRRRRGPRVATACSSRAAIRWRWPPSLRDLAIDPERRAALGEQAARSAQRYAWPRVAEQVVGAYEDAIAMPAPAGVAARIGLRPADGQPSVRPRRLPSLDPPAPAGAANPALVLARRVALGAVAAGVLLFAFLALDRIGVDNIVRSLVNSQPVWVVAGPGRHVRIDGPARDRMARHPASRAARRSGAAQGRVAGDVDRRPHVGHVAGAARRAVACAHRRAPAGAGTRVPADGPRDDRVAGAAERPGARRCSRP